MHESIGGNLCKNPWAGRILWPSQVGTPEKFSPGSPTCSSRASTASSEGVQKCKEGNADDPSRSGMHAAPIWSMASHCSIRPRDRASQLISFCGLRDRGAWGKCYRSAHLDLAHSIILDSRSSI